MRLIDTHCHLDLDRFDNDRAEVIHRAQQAGIQKMLVPAINLESCQRIRSMMRHDASIYGAFGVHPMDSQHYDSTTQAVLRDLIREERSANKQLVAIGEIGLDHYWQEVPHHIQENALRSQLELATEFELPVIVHMREHGDHARGSCFDAIFPILRDWCTQLNAAHSPLIERPGVFHSFSGDRSVLEEILSLNFFVGVTGPITYKNSEMKREVVKSIPLEKMLIETDSPFLSPIPYRGKRNEPAYVQLVAEKIAEILDVDPETIAETTTKNAGRLFSWEVDF